MKLKKLVNGKRISIRNVPIGKTGLPFQNFRLSREFSNGTNPKIVYHLHPNRNFREFVVNDKQAHSRPQHLRWPSCAEELWGGDWSGVTGCVLVSNAVQFVEERTQGTRLKNSVEQTMCWSCVQDTLNELLICPKRRIPFLKNSIP